MSERISCRRKRIDLPRRKSYAEREIMRSQRMSSLPSFAAPKVIFVAVFSGFYFGIYAFSFHQL